MLQLPKFGPMTSTVLLESRDKILLVTSWPEIVTWSQKVFHFPVSEVKNVPKAFTTWFNITYIFIRHQISNLFLAMWNQCFQNGSTVQGNKREENICLEATSLEPKLSFFKLFWVLQGSLILLKFSKFFPDNVRKMEWLKMAVCICQPFSYIT